MAKFKKVKVDPSETGEEIWTKIRNQMMVSQSVELVAVVSGQAGNVTLEVRAWDDIRKDGSNADKASPDKDY